MEYQIKWFEKSEGVKNIDDNEGRYVTEASLIGIKEIIFEDQKFDINKFLILPLIERVFTDDPDDGDKRID